MTHALNLHPAIFPQLHTRFCCFRLRDFQHRQSCDLQSNTVLIYSSQSVCLLCLYLFALVRASSTMLTVSGESRYPSLHSSLILITIFPLKEPSFLNLC